MKGDALQGSPAEMASPGPTGDANRKAARPGVPVGSAETCKGWNEVESASILHLQGCRFDLRGIRDHPHFVPEPLDHGATDKDGALEGVGSSAPALPGHRGEKSFVRGDRFFPGVHEQETAGPVGILGHPWF